ncbi:MAG: hypothetical protein KDH88_11105 [Chromatiales bacterium]|nr:hypothetical protein [Chromatiales bacterium]
MQKQYEEAKANSAIEGIVLRPEEEALFERMIALGLDAEARKQMIDAYLAGEPSVDLAAE